MISRKELINSKEYWLVKFQSALYEQVENYQFENKVSKTDFAKKLGVSKGYISQILNGDFDHKISKLIELSLAIGKVPVLKFEHLTPGEFPTPEDINLPIVEKQELQVKVQKQPERTNTKKAFIRKNEVRRVGTRKLGAKKSAVPLTSYKISKSVWELTIKK